jgi:ribosomal protein S18 acetylase RimI-like enzyme
VSDICKMKMTGIFRAGMNDINDLVLLVNSAYRGPNAKKGWTTEADLLDGLRTNAETLTEIWKRPDSTILTYRNDKEVIGCVYLQQRDKQLYLGMLTVHPERQGLGIGKQLLVASEQFALHNDCREIVMTAISVRYELIAWYERKGYHKTGETKPFPTDIKFGIPKQPLEFIVLRKTL